MMIYSYKYVCIYTHILHIDSSMGMPVQKLQPCPHSTLKGSRDTVNYRDVFRASIVIVKFLLSPSSTTCLEEVTGFDSKLCIQPSSNFTDVVYAILELI